MTNNNLRSLNRFKYVSHHIGTGSKSRRAKYKFKDQKKIKKKDFFINFHLSYNLETPIMK